MKINWKNELLPLFFIAAMFVLATVAWPHAPDRIPIHWGVSGEPNNYAGKVGLFYPPLIALGIYFLLLFLPYIDPRRRNYEKFKGSYTVIRTILVFVFMCIQVFTVLWAFGIDVKINIAVPVIVGLLFIVLGNYMGKFKPNWFTGIKTPWTLSSDESWNKTHRLGGWLFVLYGLELAISAPFQQEWLFITLGIVLGVIIVTLYVYSYFAWKADPNAKNLNRR
ncbi:MAG: SdpI family protein [Dehalococcoidales bacterium]|nr:SdpI family protein [Dehalococcoidales bacterium]